MRAFEQPEELAHEVDDCKTHIIQRVIFWPKRWKKFNPPRTIRWVWKSVPFSKNAAKKIPNDKHGLYSFALCSRIANHPHSYLVLYVGKADRMSLQARFNSYFQDTKRVKRPPISYYLLKYKDNIEFCFTSVETKATISAGENALLAALLPPCNSVFPAEVSQVIRGLR